MSDPLKDHMARQRSNSREYVREQYTPIVLWIDSTSSTQEVINYLHDEVEKLPGVHVARQNAPYRYATDGVLREEEANGKNE